LTDSPICQFSETKRFCFRGRFPDLFDQSAADHIPFKSQFPAENELLVLTRVHFREAGKSDHEPLDEVLTATADQLGLATYKFGKSCSPLQKFDRNFFLDAIGKLRYSAVDPKSSHDGWNG
jgi:hypothetical protein